MKREQLINGLAQLGMLMVELGSEKEWDRAKTGVTEKEFLNLKGLISKQFFYNGWFTKENVNQSLIALGSQLTKEGLTSWTETYSFSDNPKKVGVIMAGNIPLVGFHDFLCVVISGNTVVCKLSSDDKTLLPALAERLICFIPELKDRIVFSSGKIGEIDAVIATGSNNTLKYFEQYFGKYPHVFRKNRTSVAVINGDESKDDFHQLGKDVFNYFGLGCRNVSHLIFPKDFDLNRFFEGIIEYSSVVNHNKYANNYDYNKAIYLLNQQALLDNNFVLLRESEDLFSPLSMIHYHYYTDEAEVRSYLESHKEEIQAVVGKDYINFGQAQCPTLTDYADNINILEFLEHLKN